MTLRVCLPVANTGPRSCIITIIVVPFASRSLLLSWFRYHQPTFHSFARCFFYPTLPYINQIVLSRTLYYYYLRLLVLYLHTKYIYIKYVVGLHTIRRSVSFSFSVNLHLFSCILLLTYSIIQISVLLFVSKPICKYYTWIPPRVSIIPSCLYLPSFVDPFLLRCAHRYLLVDDRPNKFTCRSGGEVSHDRGAPISTATIWLEKAKV